MRNVINLYNERFKDIHHLEYPKTDLQILKTYKYLSSIPSVPIQEELKKIKLPKINSWKDYFCLNEDGNEYYTIDLAITPSDWNIDEIEEAIRKGKIILAENDEGIIETVTFINIDLKNRIISVNVMNNIYTNGDRPS